MNQYPISVCIITLNVTETIRQCLESVQWATEIIVLDSGSTDDTVKICQEYTPLVFSTNWPGFGKQKNRAISYATQPWVLVLDADEVLTPQLQQEIQSTISVDLSETSKTHQTHVAYRIQRQSTFMGKVIRHGDWRNDFVTRLFQRGVGQFSDDVVHETLQVKGSIGTLKSLMLHHTVTKIETSLNKLNQYSTLNAQKMVAQGKQASITQAWIHGVWTFIRSYFFKRGFLDGREGYIIALLTAQGSFYKYVKCYYLNHNKTGFPPLRK